MNPAELSGLELILAIVEGRLPPPSITLTMPMQMQAASAGYVRFSAQADARHLNPMGGVHGGFAATVLDSVTGCAVHTMLPAGGSYGTVDLNVKMLKAVPPDTPLLAEGRVLHVSKSLGVAEGSLKTADGTLLAHATASCFLRLR